MELMPQIGEPDWITKLRLVRLQDDLNAGVSLVESREILASPIELCEEIASSSELESNNFIEH